MFKKLALICLLLTASCFATVSEKDGIVIDSGGRPISGGIVRVCTGGTANINTPCSSFVTIYRDFAESLPVNQTAAPLLTDSTGNYQFFTETSPVDIQIQTRGKLQILSNVTFGGAGGSIAADEPLVITDGTMAIPEATGSVDGFLSHNDWTSFTAKFGGSVTTGFIPVVSGSGTFGTSALQDTGSLLVSTEPLTIPTEAWNSANIRAATTAYVDRGYPVKTPHQLKLLANGSNEGAAFQTALNSLASGAVIQLQAGDALNLGTSVMTWPPQVMLIGTGRQTSGQWGAFIPGGSTVTVGCPDLSNGTGCIQLGGTGTNLGSTIFRDVAFVNTTTCAPFVSITQTLTTISDVSFSGKQGTLSTNTACNDAIVLGANTVSCTTNTSCNFTGYGSYFNIYTDKIRRALLYLATAQFTDAYIHGSSTDSNAGSTAANAGVVAATCNDAGNKCGMSTLVCSTNDVITVNFGQVGGLGQSATGTIKCTGSGLIANGTPFSGTTGSILTTGNNYNAGSPTTATVAISGCPGGDTCTGPLSITSIVQGPFIDMQGLTTTSLGVRSCPGSGYATQNRLFVFGEMGNAANHTNNGDSHYNSMVAGFCATHNMGVVIADDSGTNPPPTAVYVMTSDSQANDWTCHDYQFGIEPCFQDANAGAYSNVYHDVPLVTQYQRKILGSHVGTAAAPFNDGWFAVSIGTGANANNDNQGSLAASGGAFSYTFTGGPLSGAWNVAPTCIVEDKTTPSNLTAFSISSTTLTASVTGTDVITWICWIRK